ncbi:TetR/AcrR family transcriptional regulator [Novosphingobium taihuense]|uniref:AcrR family transcriptional regulator n=1 Tax=Novosphingobium taihuense TaxID=260085 RepID=A0A7W7AEB8_9SPHN|nr:TetR/AcrR family transcriptional regulator [Novosphingobium taihuense]MBB4615428.1 AcrR family transcriptional regulator [Novosphingobium taihuense]TWH82124.1 TetR family transcriptional regulator [Novosphingobium taihuense]
MAAEDKRERVIAAAADQFMRHGFTRTTMGQIAQAADISRPALYLLFPGKEPVFEASVRDLNRIRMAEIEAALSTCTSLRDQLLTACRLWLVQVFELKCNTPDARDMDDLAFPVVVEVYRALQERIAKIIEEGAKHLPASPQDLARGLVFAVRGLGTAARDPAEMLAMTELEVELFCRAVGC